MFFIRALFCAPPLKINFGERLTGKEMNAKVFFSLLLSSALRGETTRESVFADFLVSKTVFA